MNTSLTSLPLARGPSMDSLMAGFSDGQDNAEQNSVSGGGGGIPSSPDAGGVGGCPADKYKGAGILQYLNPVAPGGHSSSNNHHHHSSHHQQQQAGGSTGSSRLSVLLAEVEGLSRQLMGFQPTPSHQSPKRMSDTTIYIADASPPPPPSSKKGELNLLCSVPSATTTKLVPLLSVSDFNTLLQAEQQQQQQQQQQQSTTTPKSGSLKSSLHREPPRSTPPSSPPNPPSLKAIPSPPPLAHQQLAVAVMAPLSPQQEQRLWMYRLLHGLYYEYSAVQLSLSKQQYQQQLEQQQEGGDEVGSIYGGEPQSGTASATRSPMALPLMAPATANHHHHHQQHNIFAATTLAPTTAPTSTIATPPGAASGGSLKPPAAVSTPPHTLSRLGSSASLPSGGGGGTGMVVRFNPSVQLSPANQSVGTTGTTSPIQEPIRGRDSIFNFSPDVMADLFVKEGHIGRRETDDAGFDTINNYAILEELGRGNFGKVMLACDEEGNQVAIKSMACGVKAPKHRFAPPAPHRDSISSVVSFPSPKAGGNSFTKAATRRQSRAPLVGGATGLGIATPPVTSVVAGGEVKAPPPLPVEPMSMVMREVAIMKKLRHKNIVQLREVIHDEEEDQTHLVMDYICNGAVAEMESDGTCVSNVEDFALAKNYLRQCATGLEYLHRQGICHRDVKPENILIGAAQDAYLADFGVSAVMREDKVVDISAGTQVFFSPELCRGDYDEAAKYGKQSDIWALGATFYAIIFGKVPFFAANMLQLASRIMSEPVPFPDDLDTDDPLREIFEGLLEKDPKKRWTLRQLRHHPAMRQVVTPQRAGDGDSEQSVSPSSDAGGIVKKTRISWEQGKQLQTLQFDEPKGDDSRSSGGSAAEGNGTMEGMFGGSRSSTLWGEQSVIEPPIEVTDAEVECAIVTRRVSLHKPIFTSGVDSNGVDSADASVDRPFQWQERRGTTRKSVMIVDRSVLSAFQHKRRETLAALNEDGDENV